MRKKKRATKFRVWAPKDFAYLIKFMEENGYKLEGKVKKNGLCNNVGNSKSRGTKKKA